MKYFVRKMKKVVVAGIITALILISANINVQANPIENVLPDLRPEPFYIGVIESNSDTAIGQSIRQGVKNNDKVLNILDNKANKIPANIDALWVSSKALTNTNIKQLFHEAKNAKKPFYVYGDDLNVKEVSDLLESNIDLEAQFGLANKNEKPNGENSIDMVGFKFENGETIPSFVISMNRGSNTYDLDELKTLTRRYNIKIEKKEKPSKAVSLLTPNVAYAAGLEASVPGFTKVYTWEATIYNWFETNRASTYHVYEVYKNDTPNDPDYKDYVMFRLDAAHLDSFQRFYSQDLVTMTNGSIITKSYEPENTSFAGSVSLTLGWPSSATVSFSTSAPIEVYSSTIDWAGDKHSFYVEDNEWLDDMIRPGDSWISSMGYMVPQSATTHKFGNLIKHQKNGTWNTAEPSDWYQEPYDSSSGDYVYWTISR